MSGAGEMTGGLDQAAKNAAEQTAAASEAHADKPPAPAPRKQGF